MTRPKTQKARKLTADSRRFTQMDTERNPFKNITAEASLDWARDPELVEAQRAQRINFFVCRETTTNKNIPQIRAKSFCPIIVSRLGKKDFLSVLCVSAVKCPNPYLRESVRICG